MTTKEVQLKAISDRLSNGEIISEDEMQSLVNGATAEELANVLMYCCSKGN